MSRSEEIKIAPSELKGLGPFFTSGRQKHASRDRNLQTRDGWTEAIPKVCCLLEVELRQLSFVQKKLLKITNYPSLPVYRTIPKPQRMPVVLTLTETTHVTLSKSSFFHPFLFLLTFSVLSDLVYVSLCLSASTSVSLFFYVCMSLKSKANKCCTVWALALMEHKHPCNKEIVIQYNTTITWYDIWGAEYRLIDEKTLCLNEPLGVIIVLPVL